MPLAITDLINTAPSGVVISQPAATPAASSWMGKLLALAQTLGLPTTAWQVGQPERTILSLLAVAEASQDVMVSMAAQGGFLDFAASGTVQVTDLNGNIVTVAVSPDPSQISPTPSAAKTWLDALGHAVYAVDRIAASYASGALSIDNSTSTTTTLAAGQMHLANPTTGATYTNTSSVTIIPTVNIGGGVQTCANNGSGLIRVTTKQAHGKNTGDVVTIVGVLGTTEANGTWTITVIDATHFDLQGSTFTNAYVSGGTISSASVSAIFQADAIGPSSSAVPLSITQLVTVLSGVTVKNALAFVGANWESNSAYAGRCRLKLAALSPNGAAAAYGYFALSSSQVLAAQTPSVVLSGGPITRYLVQTDPNSGKVTLTLANGTGPVSGVVQLAVTNATNQGGLVKITVGSTTGLANGNWVTVSGVVGVQGANITTTISNLTGTTFTLDGSTFSGVYVSGGSVEGGDLGQVDGVIHAQTVPNAVTELTKSATATPINIVTDIYVPAASVAAAAAAVQTALANYFATVPIGGVTDPAGSYTQVVPFNEVLGVIVSAILPFNGQQAKLTLNGGTADISTPPPSVGSLGTVTINQHGV